MKELLLAFALAFTLAAVAPGALAQDSPATHPSIAQATSTHAPTSLPSVTSAPAIQDDNSGASAVIIVAVVVVQPLDGQRCLQHRHVSAQRLQARLPVDDAFSVVIAEAPPIFNIAALSPLFVNAPLPDNAVPTVSVPLLVRVIPVTVTLGINRVPESAWVLVSKV